MIQKYYNIVFTILFVSGILSLTSCDKHTISHRYHCINSDGWYRSDTLFFAIDSIESDNTYHFILDLRTTNDCPYKSLWLTVEKELCPNATFECDTIEFVLTNQQHQRTGTGIHLLQYSKEIKSTYLNRGTNGSIRIYHIMNDDCLTGIRDIGIRIEQ